jgi:hypothetical protein
MNRYIKEITSKLQEIERTHAFHKDTVLAILALVRQHLEANRLQSTYKVTNFFCNWCLHTSLDRDPMVEDIFQQIDDLLCDSKKASPNDKINEFIALQQLRAELLQIVGSNSGSCILNTWAGWKAFAQTLQKSLLDKPLLRKGKPAVNRRVAQLILVIPDISDMPKDYVDQYSIFPNTPFWEIRVLPKHSPLPSSYDLTKTYTITGPLMIPERREDFG